MVLRPIKRKKPDPPEDEPQASDSQHDTSGKHLYPRSHVHSPEAPIPAAKIGGIEVTPRFTFTATGIFLGICVLFGVFGAFSDDNSDSGSSRTTSNSTNQSDPELNSAGARACREYRQILRNLDAGVLTDIEFRSAVQDANRWAEASGDRQITQGSESALRALTTGTDQQAADALIDVHERCDHFGH